MKDFLRQAFGRGPLSARRAAGALWDGERLWAARFLRRPGEPPPEGPEASWSGVLAEAPAALRRAGLDRDPVQAVLPQDMVLAKRLRFPSTDPAELRDMAALAAARQLPLPPEELLTDLRVLESDGDGHSRVLLFVARREDVLRWTSTYGAAGLAVERLVPAAAALEPLLARAAAPGETLIAVEAGPSSTLLALWRGGTLRFARGFPAGRDRLEKEVRETLLAYEREEPLSEPVRVLAWAPAPAAAGFLEELSRAFPWRVDPFPSAGGEDLPPSARGAAEAGPGAPNLLPPDAREDRSRRGRRREALAFAGLAALTLLSVGIGAAREARHARRRLEVLDARWGKVSGEVKELEALDRRLLRLRRPGEVTELSGLLAALNRHLPPQVTLLSLTFERDKGAVLQGASLSLAQAVGAANALEKSGLFKEVELRSSNARPSHGRETVEFQVRLGFSREERP